MYISLLSDASSELFPGNRIGSFTCKLPHPVPVDRNKQEIGLSYISWPHKLANVEDGTFRIRIAKRPNVETHTTRVGDEITLSFSEFPQETVTRRITPGYYATVQKLIAALNEKIKTTKFKASHYQHSAHGPPCEFRYDETTEKVTFHSDADRSDERRPGGNRPDDESDFEYKINLSWELYIKLGYGLERDGNSWVKNGDQTPHTADLDSGQNSVLVYTDCIEQNRLFANTVGPLLRLVPFSGEHGSQMHFEPQRVEYCQLRTDTLSEIKIEIRDDRGEVFKFLSGKVSVTLHIRDIPI